MSPFEVYYVVQKDKKQRDRIVAGPYYKYLEASNASSKLEKDCPHRHSCSFEVMTYIIEIYDNIFRCEEWWRTPYFSVVMKNEGKL